MAESMGDNAGDLKPETLRQPGFESCVFFALQDVSMHGPTWRQLPHGDRHAGEGEGNYIVVAQRRDGKMQLEVSLDPPHLSRTTERVTEAPPERRTRVQTLEIGPIVTTRQIDDDAESTIRRLQTEVIASGQEIWRLRRLNRFLVLATIAAILGNVAAVTRLIQTQASKSSKPDPVLVKPAETTKKVEPPPSGELPPKTPQLFP